MKKWFMGGGLLACLLAVTLNVNAADSTIKSQGVLKLKDSSGKQIVFDASDLKALNDKVDNLSTPKLKITYHEHTDTCHKICAYATYNAYIDKQSAGSTLPTSFNASTIYELVCTRCRATLDTHTGAWGSITDFGTNYKDTYPYKTCDGSYRVEVPGHLWVSKHTSTCPYFKVPAYSCGKDENTIESIELVE